MGDPGADHGREDKVGSQRGDFSSDVQVAFPAGIQRDVDLSQFFSTLLENQVANDAIRFVGVDVVGTDHEDARSKIAQHIAGQGYAVLIGRCAGVDNIAAVLKALLE